MKTIKVTLNKMELEVYNLCVSATEGSDNGAMFCFNEVSVPAERKLNLSEEEVKGYLSSLKKKDVIRKLHDSYYDFVVVNMVEDDYDWFFLDDLYRVEIICK